MPESPHDEIGSLESARERLYRPEGHEMARAPLAPPGERAIPHAWDTDPAMLTQTAGKRHIRLASLFFGAAFVFFLISLMVAGYVFFFGGNSVSVDKITITIQGPTTIAGGDTVPLSISITNKNPVAVEEANIEIDFPDGTRDAANVLNPYPRYSEDLGTIASGETVTRSIKAVVFGGEGQTVTLPVIFSFGTTGSNATFVKKSSYPLTISSTPLSVSVESLTETVSGKPITFTLIVRSNAAVPLQNVVLSGAFPFGFSVNSSSLPITNSSFLIGTLAPGATKTITLTGTLLGQDNEKRVFRFTVGTAKTPTDQTLAVTYMTQDATLAIAAPFIETSLAVNGDASPTIILSPNSLNNATLSYSNTLPTSVTNAQVIVAISGSAVDYGSIRASNGFYNSADHTIIFSRDTDPSLGTLAPGASGIGAFSFETLPADLLASSPTVLFSISVSGTRVGQTDVPEQVSASATKTAKVATAVQFSASALHNSGPFVNGGPIPPRAGQVTNYAIVWRAQNRGSAVADGTVTAVLPIYVSYTDKTSGSGTFSYDSNSRTVTWNIGDLAQGSSAQGSFQIALTPSTSQKGNAPDLTGEASFSGHDRFAGVQLSASASPVTTETKGDPGYSANNAIVQ